MRIIEGPPVSPMSPSVAAIFECICNETQFGDTVRVVGNTRDLKCWKPEDAWRLTTSPQQYPLWRSESIDLHSIDENANEFKFIIVSPRGSVRWEPGANRILKLAQLSKDGLCRFRVHATYGNPALEIHKECGAEESNMTVPSSPTLDALTMRDPLKESAIAEVLNSETDTSISAWKGREIAFVKSRSALHRLQNQSVVGETTLPYNVEDAGILSSLLTGNTHAQSFLQKLQLVQSLVSSLKETITVSGKEHEALELLAGITVYLTLIRTGVVPCKEAGGHYRPSHHATASNDIFQTLTHLSFQFPTVEYREKHDQYKDMTILLVRRILPLLPSFSKNFTCSVPLTRIRDIAHRNDISSDLKAELKHTLQNKLHRCAGPEDLVAAQHMLKRILARSHEYSEGFLREFTQFYEELKEFFNAQSLEDQLKRLVEVLQTQPLQHVALHVQRCWIETVYRFLVFKTELKMSPTNAKLLLETLAATTALRNDLELMLSEDATETEQLLWQADIGLEHFAFAVLGQLNRLTADDTTWKRIPLTDPTWLQQLQALHNGVVHLQLTGVFEGECRSIAQDIATLIRELPQRVKKSTQRGTWEFHLRVYSTLERLRRLAETLTELMTSVFASATRHVGAAVYAPAHTIATFAEAEVRASVLYQVSQLTTSLMSRIAAFMGDAGLDVIVEPKGTPAVYGTVVHVDTLEHVPVPSTTDNPAPVIVVLQKATGDEEVAGLLEEKNIVALILMHSIPLLSHLGIRARQGGLPFVSVVNPHATFVDDLRALVGKQATLTFSSDGLSCNAFVVLNDPLKLTNPLYVGAKAAHCAKLQALEAHLNIQTPACLVLQFGCMEHVLSSTGQLEHYNTLLETLDRHELTREEFEDVYTQLHSLLKSFAIPSKEQTEEILEQVTVTLGLKNKAAQSLMVRSSANVEDTIDVSAAGLYDSVSNVPAEPLSLSRAISTVWASLHSRRAVLSRKTAGIPQTSARMAVLIQNIIVPHLCFVAHTVAPLSSATIAKAVQATGLQTVKQDIPSSDFTRGNPNGHGKNCGSQEAISSTDWIYVELAHGLGEVLAGARIQGYAHRMLIHKHSGDYAMLGFASLSTAFVPTNPEADSQAFTVPVIPEYSKDWFWQSDDARRLVARRLRDVCVKIEITFNAPQDIEGSLRFKTTKHDTEAEVAAALECDQSPADCIDLAIVQTRPQPL